jgi:polysaccharide export outer membrane protein
MQRWARTRVAATLIALAAVGCAGCHTAARAPVAAAGVPRELDKMTIPDYVIEPPDVLRITAIRLVPLPPYRIQPLDALTVNVTGTFPNQPIAGVYPVSPDGRIDLGFSYGTVAVLDKTTPEVEAAVTELLSGRLKDLRVAVSLAQLGAVQQVQGEHLVSPDGKVTLGAYGSVRVVGKTRDEAKAAIEAHLGKYLFRPEVALDVAGYNSKVYYLVTDGGGAGEQVVRVPFTGNETVLDAVSQINGLPNGASRKHVWVARPAVPAQGGCPCQVLPVDWPGIVECGDAATNYQVLPGDRVYVKAQPLVRVDNALARALSPVERVLGVGLLGSTIYRNVSLNNRNVGAGTVIGVIP